IHPSLLYHLQLPPLPLSTLFPYTTLFRSNMGHQLDFLAKRKRIRGRAEILSKGQDMTIRELRSLLERYNVRKKTLRKALRMDSDAFYAMLHNLGLSEPVKEMTEK